MIEDIKSFTIPSIERIIYSSIVPYPSKKGNFITLIIFEDNNSHPFLLLFELNDISFYIKQNSYSNEWLQSFINAQFNSNLVIDKNENTIFKIFDLNYKPPKKMTREEVEKELGYKIEIIK